MYTVIQISDLLNVTVNVVYKAVYDLQMIREVCTDRKNYYSEDQLLKLKGHVKERPEIVKYYPLKTTETFYIYQSKINNQ